MAHQFWQDQFADLETSLYPVLPITGYQPEIKHIVDYEVDWPDWSNLHHDHYSLSIKLQGAWAIMLAQYSNSEDIVFGTNVISQREPLGRAENLSRLNYVMPLRVPVPWHSELIEWLRNIQARLEAIDEVQTWGGLDQIRSLSSKVAEACDFRTILLVHNGRRKEREHQNIQPPAINDIPNTGGVALIVECLPSARHCSLLVRFHTDRNILDSIQAKQMGFQFTNLVSQLFEVNLHQQGKRIIDLDTVCEEDKTLIWKWNACRPRRNDICITDLFSQQVKRRANHPAVHAWDGHITYSQLDELSTLLAKYLLHTQIASPGGIVPVCFNKTMWTTITILAIAKAGATFILLDPYQPPGRLAAIMDQIQSSTILARLDTAELAQSLSSHVVIIDRGFRERGPFQSNVLGGTISPSDHLYHSKQTGG
ncbi:unnamed protein product [Penicillium glandicola]